MAYTKELMSLNGDARAEVNRELGKIETEFGVVNINKVSGNKNNVKISIYDIDDNTNAYAIVPLFPASYVSGKKFSYVFTIMSVDLNTTVNTYGQRAAYLRSTEYACEITNTTGAPANKRIQGTLILITWD